MIYFRNFDQCLLMMWERSDQSEWFGNWYSSRMNLSGNKFRNQFTTRVKCNEISYRPVFASSCSTHSRFSFQPELVSVEIRTSRVSACWSRGMILASGARGPGFKSRTGPFLRYLLIQPFSNSFCHWESCWVEEK